MSEIDEFDYKVIQNMRVNEIQIAIKWVCKPPQISPRRD